VLIIKFGEVEGRNRFPMTNLSDWSVSYVWENGNLWGGIQNIADERPHGRGLWEIERWEMTGKE
jgi:hypothetical protein